MYGEYLRVLEAASRVDTAANVLRAVSQTTVSVITTESSIREVFQYNIVPQC